MRRVAERPIRRVLAIAALLPLLLAGARSAAADPVENPHGKFKEDCALCHDARGWSEVHVSARFDHARYGFRLEGAHAATACRTCHVSLDFARARVACASCHADPHRGELGTECQRCHGARSFVDRAPMVRAHLSTRLPLTGSHAGLDCEDCHRPAAQGQMQFAGTPVECRDCHLDQYRAAKSPDHVAGGFPLQCETCHATGVWTSARFDHDRTDFPLTGAHRAVACTSCHSSGTFTRIRTDCVACHQSTYDGAQPPHTAASFPPAQCATCHTTTSWTTAFDHSTTRFPLTGAHRALTCANCHADGVYAGKSVDCIGCHQPDYSATTNPPHVPSAFPTTTAACTGCHNTTAWQPSTFSHAATNFPLTGAHPAVSCTGCHNPTTWTTAGTDCYACHTADYAGTTNPKHDPVGFPTAGCTCHTTTSWSGASSFDHAAAGFPLANAHATPPRTCTDCHASGYTATSPDCYSCHQANYAAATNPPHVPASFPTATASCTGCHNTVAWQPSTFNHANTPFPLSGAHPAVACTGCHNATTWVTPGKDCYSCHQADYAATTDPKHDPSAFPTAGCTCHNTTSWANATFFDHTAGGFALTGAHADPPRTCTDCHASGYTATSTACASCHTNSSPGYATASPAHDPVNFPPANCLTCHASAASYTSWAGGTFPNHTWFPITSGNHNLACAQCHTSSSNLALYNCSVACHASAVANHDHVTNSCGTFSSTTAATMCYCCHPSGRAG